VSSANPQPERQTMKNNQRNNYVTRDSILELLSDDEVAAVSTAETASTLANGDEYIDLEHVDRGVLRAITPTRHMGRVLPRGAVQPSTWVKIMSQLEASTRTATTLPGYR
jgi:hypothetical protein